MHSSALSLHKVSMVGSYSYNSTCTTLVLMLAGTLALDVPTVYRMWRAHFNVMGHSYPVGVKFVEHPVHAELFHVCFHFAGCWGGVTPHLSLKLYRCELINWETIWHCCAVYVVSNGMGILRPFQ
jgi:hypothetical protein